MPKPKSSTLTEAEWQRVFQLRCKSKSGHTLTNAEYRLVTRAHQSDPKRYHAMEADVFNATVPFGSTSRYK